MDSPRDLVNDALDSIERIERRLTGVDAHALSRNDVLLDSVERRLMIVAEAFKGLSESTKEVARELFPVSPYTNRLRSFADRVRHDYSQVSADKVMRVVHNDLPVAKDALIKLAGSSVLDEAEPEHPPPPAKRTGLSR